VSLISYCKLTELLIPVTFIREVYQLRFWLGNWLSELRLFVVFHSTVDKGRYIPHINSHTDMQDLDWHTMAILTRQKIIWLVTSTLQNSFRYGHVVQTYHQLPFNFMRCDSTMFMLIFFLEGLQLLFFPSFTLFFQLLLLLLLPELLSRKKKGVPASRIKKVKSLLISLHTMNAWGKGDIAPLILNFSTRQMQMTSFMTQPLFFF